MAKSMEQTLEGEDDDNNNNRGSGSNPNQSQEWETMARLWLSAFPGVKAVSGTEVESWIDSNYSSLPSDLQSMPRSDLVDRLLSIQNYMRLPDHSQQVPCAFIIIIIIIINSSSSSKHYELSSCLFSYIRCRRRIRLMFHMLDFNALINGCRFIPGWNLWIKMRWSSPKIFLIGWLRIQGLENSCSLDILDII
jgi:hypothetical protein